MTTLTITKTEEVLQHMLMENTGINICDSGGESNRHWQKNANGEFTNKPSAYIEYDTVNLSLYHYLLDRLEYSPFQMAQFRMMFPGETTGLNKMREFVEAWRCESTGEPINTYNFETLLDQNIQFIEYTIDDGWGGVDTYVILQTHNGADARVGYSQPWIFKSKVGDSWLHQVQDIDLECKLCCLYFSVSGYDVNGYDVNGFDEEGTDVGRDSFAHIWDGVHCPSCQTAFDVSAPEVYC